MGLEYETTLCDNSEDASTPKRPFLPSNVGKWGKGIRTVLVTLGPNMDKAGLNMEENF